MLESGILLLFTVSKHSGDIENILIDRSLLTRIDGALNKGLHIAFKNVLHCNVSSVFF